MNGQVIIIGKKAHRDTKRDPFLMILVFSFSSLVRCLFLASPDRNLDLDLDLSLTHFPYDFI